MTTQSLEPAAHNARSSFLNRLPTEVRYEIYKVLFQNCDYPVGSIFDISERFDYDFWYTKVSENRSRKRIISILQVCKQTRSEAIPIFQNLVMIVLQEGFSRSNLPLYFEPVLGPKGTKRLEVPAHWCSSSTIAELLEIFPALEVLRFHGGYDELKWLPSYEYSTIDLSKPGPSTAAPRFTDTRDIMFESILKRRNTKFYADDAPRMAQDASAFCRPGLDISIDVSILFVDAREDRAIQTDGGVS